MTLARDRIQEALNLGLWTVCTSTRIEEKALKLARGSYQRRLVYGHEALSGSTLSTRGQDGWGSKYALSRYRFLKRLEENGIPTGTFCVGRTGRKILLIGAKKVRTKVPERNFSGKDPKLPKMFFSEVITSLDGSPQINIHLRMDSAIGMITQPLHQEQWTVTWFPVAAPHVLDCHFPTLAKARKYAEEVRLRILEGWEAAETKDL